MRFYEYNKLNDTLNKNGVSITYSGLKYLPNHILFNTIEVA